MPPKDVRSLVFSALDQAQKHELLDPAVVRGVLCVIALNHGYEIDRDLDRYLDMLIEEFCPAHDLFASS
jgi:hypothetical protein